LEVHSNLYWIKSCLLKKLATLPRIGEYWEKLLAVCDHKVEVIHSQTMNKIFQDKVISYVVGILWAAIGLLPSMWSVEMNVFAFGHT
jgi:hypothetical protein